jgi:hypothetical protein
MNSQANAVTGGCFMRKLLKKILCFTTFVIITLAFSGCGTLVNEIKNKTGNRGASADKVIKSNDNKSQITVGGDWQEDKELNAEANIQASNRQKEKYIIVISEPKEDFSVDMKIEDFANIVRDGIIQSGENVNATEPVDMTINGLPGKYFEVQGEVQKVKVRYLAAVVNGKNTYHQVLTWTLNSKYEENKEELKKVIQSFKELE